MTFVTGTSAFVAFTPCALCASAPLADVDAAMTPATTPASIRFAMSIFFSRRQRILVQLRDRGGALHALRETLQKRSFAHRAVRRRDFFSPISVRRGWRYRQSSITNTSGRL